MELIRDATWRYAAAIASGLAMLEPGYVDDRVVCERCGLVQDFRRAEDGDEVDPCESCGGLLAISIERYREETAEPLIYIYDS